MSGLHVVGDVRLRLDDGQGDVLAPGNDGGQPVLQRHQFADICFQLPVGGVGGTARPDTTVENLPPLVLAGLQDLGDLPQNLRVLL
jgi:hypothetical protein